MDLLKKLCETPAVPGREQRLIDIMKSELKKTTDEVITDVTGNVVGIKKSSKKNALRVMIAGHMDEIGFIVSHIDKSGFIRFAIRGGHVPRVLISQRVKIVGKKTTVVGVVEASPAFLNKELMNKAPEVKEMFIDTGLTETALKKIISIGDPIVLDRDFISQGDIYMSKAFDNRVGCYVVLDTMKKLKGKKLNVDVFAVGTTQEEVGVIGASTASLNITPDFGIAIDVTAAFDTPGVAEHEQVTQLRNGVAIKINDHGTISNHGVVEHFKAIAKKSKIKFQMEILPFGGTDAIGMQRSGNAAVCTLSVPTRYVHSPNEIITKKDLDNTVSLLVKFIETSHTCKVGF